MLFSLFKKNEKEESKGAISELEQQINKFKANSFVQQVMSEIIECMNYDIQRANRDNSEIIVPLGFVCREDLINFYYGGVQFSFPQYFREEYGLDEYGLKTKRFYSNKIWRYSQYGLKNLSTQEKYYISQAIKELIYERFEFDKQQGDYNQKVDITVRRRKMTELDRMMKYTPDVDVSIMYTAKNGKLNTLQDW